MHNLLILKHFLSEKKNTKYKNVHKAQNSTVFKNNTRITEFKIRVLNDWFLFTMYLKRNFGELSEFISLLSE